jgi:twitching motility protein PilT
MVRANGDALVMHVGERPYVVAGAGTIDLSTQTLHLEAMTGMLQQLLPVVAQDSLEEFGAVEHHLPSREGDAFTVVAARGGDDIWIEIRRRRNAAVTAAAPPVAAPVPVAPPVVVAVPVAEPAAPPVVESSPAPEIAAAVHVPAPIAAEPPLPEVVTAVETAPPVEAPIAEIAAVALTEEPSAEDLAIQMLDQLLSQPPELTEVEEFEAAVAAAPSPVEAPVAPVEHAALAAPVARVAPEAPAAPELAAVLPMIRTVRFEVPARTATLRAAGVERLLRLAAARAASTLFVASDCRPAIRVEGDIRPLDGEPPLSRAEVEAAVLELVPATEQEAVGRGESTEWITEFPELGRVRCITFTDHRGPGVVFRMIETRAATAEQLGLSREVQALATEPQGLVLVAGTRGTGKSTLVSALVDLVNRQRAEYVVTLERQIRLVHDNRAAIVSQREIRGGAEEALSAARAALREGPDVLVVDDLASSQMVPLLLEAASEGLVFVSITAPSTTDAVERFTELAPADMRAGVQAAMAETFRGAVAQVLLKKTGGGRVAAREVLLATAPVTRVIADGVPGQLRTALEGGRKHGMVPLADALVSLVQSGVVDVREAFRKAPDRDRLLAGLRREGIDTTVVDRLA